MVNGVRLWRPRVGDYLVCKHKNDSNAAYMKGRQHICLLIRKYTTLWLSAQELILLIRPVRVA